MEFEKDTSDSFLPAGPIKRKMSLSEHSETFSVREKDTIRRAIEIVK